MFSLNDARFTERKLLQIRIAGEGDLVKWDDYVTSNPEATPYHLSGWKKSFEQAYGHKGYYLIAESDGNIIGVLPICYIKPALFSGSLCSLPFCDVGGVLANNAEVQSALVERAVDLGKQLKVSSLEIRVKDSGKVIGEQIGHEQHQMTKVIMELSLPENSEQLKASFKSKLRSQINKAEKNGLTFYSGTEKSHIDDFYQVLSQNMRSLGSPVHAKDWFEAIRQTYGADMLVGIVAKDEKIIGAGILLFVGNRATIPWASTLTEFNKLAPNMLLYWNLLKYSCDKGYKLFDFGRSTVGEGTYKFKKQWGAIPQALHWSHYNRQGEAIAAVQGQGKLRTKLEKIWSHLPLKITNYIGPKVRKYISL